jgi:hypothetical protein
MHPATVGGATGGAVQETANSLPSWSATPRLDKRRMPSLRVGAESSSPVELTFIFAQRLPGPIGPLDLAGGLVGRVVLGDAGRSVPSDDWLGNAVSIAWDSARGRVALRTAIGGLPAVFLHQHRTECSSARACGI